MHKSSYYFNENLPFRAGPTNPWGRGGGRLTVRRKVPPPIKGGSRKGHPREGIGWNRKSPAEGYAMKLKSLDHLRWLKKAARHRVQGSRPLRLMPSEQKGAYYHHSPSYPALKGDFFSVIKGF